MIPNNENYEDELLDDLENDFEEEIEPGLTYAMIGDRFVGMIDGGKALEQTIYKILRTERYEHLIYSWDYGIELQDLIGMDTSYVMTELESRISDALTMDDRIEEISDFSCEITEKGKLFVTFIVVSLGGEIPIETEVGI